MASYTDLDSAAKAATATITAAGAARGWPAASTATMIADIESARVGADGWFSSSATECEAFWRDLHVRYSFWDGSLDGMDSVGTWIASEAYLTESKAATAEAQSWTTILAGTAAGSANDVGAIVAAGADAATTVNTLAKNQTAWIVGGIGLLALLLWKVGR